MEEMQVSQHLTQVLRRTLRVLSRQAGREVAEFNWQDANHRDILARELYHDTKVGADECAKFMRDLTQPSPGGLLAVAWLCRYGQVNPDTLLSYCCGLLDGAPIVEALDEKDGVEVFEKLTQGPQHTKSSRILISLHLLSTMFMGNKARLECLARVMTLTSFNTNERKSIFEWAMGLDVSSVLERGDIIAPDAPLALARAGINGMVDMGCSSNDIIRHIITNINAWEDKRYILHGVLDIIEREFPDLQASMRRQAFEICLLHDDPSLRRRVYRLAERTEPREFLLKATKDKDASVRRWAIGMIRKK